MNIVYFNNLFYSSHYKHTYAQSTQNNNRRRTRDNRRRANRTGNNRRGDNLLWYNWGDWWTNNWEKERLIYIWFQIIWCPIMREINKKFIYWSLVFVFITASKSDGPITTRTECAFSFLVMISLFIQWWYENYEKHESSDSMSSVVCLKKD